ncbi:MAG TPA: cytochrome C oxidase subunit IV family protein [Pyrinomonadaceae bacterium]|nr:cytochrome C oxidase subunit IV family protein [Pyrinomonadaceae bacterium]
MSEHIVSRTVYFVIFGALMVGTALTVIAARIDFGNEVVNTVIALTIAVTKATLVVLFFMHVRYSARIIMVLVASGFFWLAIMMVLTASDYVSREWASPLAPTAQGAPAGSQH